MPSFNVRHLRVGDVLIVQGYNAVAASQYLTSFFGQVQTQRGASTSVHAALVTDQRGGLVQVAHVVRTGCTIAHIGPVTESTPEDAERSVGYVFRLMHAAQEVLSKRDIRVLKAAAAQQAKRMAFADIIDLSILGSITSVFKSPKYGEGLIDWDSIHELDRQLEKVDAARTNGDAEAVPHVSMFCSEFIVKAWQLAMVKLEMQSRFLHVMDVDAVATTPQSLHGYLLSARLDGWCCMGKADFVFM